MPSPVISALTHTDGTGYKFNQSVVAITRQQRRTTSPIIRSDDAGVRHELLQYLCAILLLPTFIPYFAPQEVGSNNLEQKQEQEDLVVEISPAPTSPTSPRHLLSLDH